MQSLTMWEKIETYNFIIIIKLTKTSALDSQLQVIKFTSCLPMVGGSLQVLRLLPPLKLKLIAMI
jgi:hypothetical protein